jgi:hypothetical protein
MKKRLVRLAMISLVLLITGGSMVVLARNIEQSKDPLARRVLQKGDLPQNIQGYYTEPLTDDRFPGPSCPASIPLQFEGYLSGYEMSAWYPFNLQETTAQSKQGGLFILNIAYQYHDKDQATRALERQLKWFNRQDIAMNAQVTHVGYDESLAAANDVNGSAMQLTYSQEDQAWVTYWFLGVKDNTSMLLMVDGLPDPATQEVFDSLVTIVVQR